MTTDPVIDRKAEYLAVSPEWLCCASHNPRVQSPEQSFDVGQPGQTIPPRVTKGGSHLCAPNYCLRYRPAARQPQMIESSTCIIRLAPA
jgi:formylglycine-generating enzyme